MGRSAIPPVRSLQIGSCHATFALPGTNAASHTDPIAVALNRAESIEITLTEAYEYVKPQ